MRLIRQILNTVDHRFPSESMVIGLIAALVFICIASPVKAQGLDTAQTNIAPIGGTQFGVGPPANTGPFGSGGFGASNAFGNTFGNTSPRIRFGTAGSTFMDPYAGGGVSAPTFSQGGLYPTPSAGAFPPSNGPFPSFGNGFGSGGPAFGGQIPPLFGQGGLFGAPELVPNSGYGGSGFGSAIYPEAAIPSGSPSTLFPGGIFQGGLLGGGAFAGGGPTVFRFLQGPRFRHTYIYGGDSRDDLTTNDTDVSVAFAFPNFLGSTRPLFVVPSFSLHLWDGPDGSTGADLPANAYSAFLDFGWQSDPNQMFGIELGARVGAFTEFDTFRDESIRILGKALGAFRLTPFTTLKLGAYYLDRNKVKVLPAGGLLWQPNAYTRFDIFFPQPKFARYWRTVGTRDVWWYITGDYGGGSWTIERDDGSDDSVDINDIRVMAGLEWGLTNLIQVGRRTGFAEIGYVFDRELIYRRSPEDNLYPDDGILFRLGVGY